MSTDKNPESIVTVIERSKSFFGFNWRELWNYRDLIWILAKRDLFVVYKQTVLGPIWFLIQPVLMALVFTVVFGRVANINTGGVPHTVFYMAGTVAWNFFVAIMSYSALSLISNANVLTKVWFPRLALPIASVATNLAHLVLGIVIFLVFFIWEISAGATIAPTWWILALPLIVIYLALLGLGVGLWMAAATVKYRDLRFALPFIQQIWMYATPIIYPASGVVDPKLRAILLANPVAPAIEAFRYVFTGAGTVGWESSLIGIATTLFLFLGGVAAFNRAQRNFADII